MKNRRLMIVAGVLILLILAILFGLFFAEERFSWQENYQQNNDQPYGTQVLYQMLKADKEDLFIEVDTSFALTMAKDSFMCPATYYFVGRRQYLGDHNTEALLEFVEAGNNAFISTNILSVYLTDELNIDGCQIWGGFDQHEDSTIIATFVHPEFAEDTGYSFTYVYEKDTSQYLWNYMETWNWCTENTDAFVLGNIDTVYDNFIKVPYGEGSFYIHANPIMFTNYYMIEQNGFDHYNTVASHWPDGDIIWDEPAHRPFKEAPPEEDESNRPVPDTPLQFILSHQSLKWAWYIMLVSVLLYLVFHMKRRQRVIPVIEPYENTSIEFARTLSDLHFINKDHLSIVKKMMRSFKYHLRNRYKINTDQHWDTYVKTLSLKSDIPEHILSQLFKRYDLILLKVEKRKEPLNEDDLIALYKLIQHFHKNSK